MIGLCVCRAVSRSDDDNHEKSATPAFGLLHVYRFDVELALFLCLSMSLRIPAIDRGVSHAFLINPRRVSLDRIGFLARPNSIG